MNMAIVAKRQDPYEISDRSCYAIVPGRLFVHLNGMTATDSVFWAWRGSKKQFEALQAQWAAKGVEIYRRGESWVREYM